MNKEETEESFNALTRAYAGACQQILSQNAIMYALVEVIGGEIIIPLPVIEEIAKSNKAVILAETDDGGVRIYCDVY